MKRDYTSDALQYCHDVVDGVTPACQWIKLACKRHLDDLAASESSLDYPYYYSRKHAHRICKFAELLPHVKGKWSRSKQRLHLEPWQCFILICIFGWLRRKDDLRRFRQAYIYVPRKNGKSLLSTVVGLFMLALDNEPQAEIYAGATTERQADFVFRPAQQIVGRTPGLRQLGIQVLANSLVTSDGSKMCTVIGQPPDGASPSCALLDESHEWPNDLLLSTMVTGMGAREQPLVFMTTTAGYNTAGPAKLMQDDLQDVLLGIKQDDELFGVIYAVDEGVDWKSELALRQANPNLDVSVSLEFLQTQINKAILSPRKQTEIKTKHLNIWCAAAIGWIPIEAWQKCGSTLSIEDFIGQPCWAGLDLATTNDLSAYVLIFKRIEDGQPHYYCFPRFWIPAAQVDDPSNGHYKQWAPLGHLDVVPGPVNRFVELTAQIIDDAKRFDLREVAFDPAYSSQVVPALQDAGITVVEISQRSVPLISGPMVELEAITLTGQLHHPNHPVLTWCIANTVASFSGKDRPMPVKASAEKKIDGTMATIMGLGRAQLGSIERPKKKTFTPQVW